MRTASDTVGPAELAAPGIRTLTLDRVWTVAALVIPVVTAWAARLPTIDLAYHVRAGEQILTGAIPRVDTFTFSAAGGAWLDQQWGAQVLIALAHRAGSWPAEGFLHGVLVGVTYLFVWLACRAAGAQARSAAFLTIGSFVVGVNTLAMRPEAFALPLFTATLWILAGRGRHPRRLWAIPFLAVPWANLHGSFPLVAVLLGIALATDLMERRPVARTTAAVGIVAMLATLITPFGPGAWSYVAELAANPTIRTATAEWAPPSITTVTGACFFLSAAAVAFFLARRGSASPWPPLLSLAVFFLLALPAMRGVVWWSLAAPVAVAALLPMTPPRPGRDGSQVMNALIVAILSAAVVIALPTWRVGTDPATGASRILADPPGHLTDAAAIALPDRARIVAWQPWGSWFEYAVPTMPVFVDSRVELFPDRVWDDYLNLTVGHEGWDVTLDRWRVDAVALPADDVSLLPLMQAHAGWRIAFRDETGVLFVRA